jgi:hypothetical protein
MTLQRTMTPAFLALVFIAVSGVRAQEVPRLSDSELKSLIENVHHARDRFEDALDGEFKHSIVRGPRGEAQVNQYLDDLQENVNRLKDRYNSSYSASAEARTVLQQGSDIARFMQNQPDSMKGRSEWDRMAGSLGTLAHAYARRSRCRRTPRSGASTIGKPPRRLRRPRRPRTGSRRRYETTRPCPRSSVRRSRTAPTCWPAPARTSGRA